MNGTNQSIDLDIVLPSGINFLYFGLECNIQKEQNYNSPIIGNFDLNIELGDLNIESSVTGIE